MRYRRYGGGKAVGLRRGADWAAEGRLSGWGGKADTLQRGAGWAAIAEEGKGKARELRQKSEMFFYRLCFTSFFVVYVLIMRYIDVVTAMFL